MDDVMAHQRLGQPVGDAADDTTDPTETSETSETPETPEAPEAPETPDAVGSIDVVAAARGDDALDASTAAALLGLLIPVAEADPSTHAAVDAVRHVVDRCEESVVAALGDWWLVAGAGDKSARGLAWRLRDFGLEGELLAVMEQLRDLAARLKVPPLRWLAETQRLPGLVDAARTALDYESHGASKVQGEHLAWTAMEVTFAPTLEALEQGRPTSVPEVPAEDIKRRMKDGRTKKGSIRWRQVLERADDCRAAVARAAEVQALVQPWAHAELVAPHAGPVPDLGRDARPLLPAVLHVVVTACPAPDPGEVRRRLAAAAEHADDAALSWLEDLTAGWAIATGEDLAVLHDRRRRQEVIFRHIEELEHVAVDVAGVYDALGRGDLDAAEQAVAAAQEGRRERDRLLGVRHEVDRLLAAAEGLPEVEARAAEVLTHVERGDSATALDKVRELRDVAATWTRRRDVERHGRLIDGLDAAGASRRRLDELRVRHERLAEDPQLAFAPGELEKLEDQVRQAESEARRHAGEAIAQVQALRRERELVEDAHAPVDQAMHEAQDAFDAGNFAAVREATEIARTLIERSQIESWRAAEGEARLVEHIERFVQGDFDFTRADIRRLHVALKTKPFVVLAGLTGSGKSTIARLFAEAVGATTENGRFVRVTARPNWVDQTEVLGYFDPLARDFVPGWLATLIRTCERDPDLPFFLLLDEMNLAPVEQYFAEALSAMEEARTGSTARLNLYPEGVHPSNAEQWEPYLTWPRNLFVLGTVNIDESTRSLSDRVLDRASVIQLSLHVGDSHHHLPTRRSREPAWSVRVSEWRQICLTTPTDRHHDFLIDLGSQLLSMRIGIGMRAHVDIELFLANATTVIDDVEALDDAILQQVMPKIRGFKRDLVEGLVELRELFDGAGCASCAHVVEDWAELPDDAYIDGGDHALAMAVAGY